MESLQATAAYELELRIAADDPDQLVGFFAPTVTLPGPLPRPSQHLPPRAPERAPRTPLPFLKFVFANGEPGAQLEPKWRQR